MHARFLSEWKGRKILACPSTAYSRFILIFVAFARRLPKMTTAAAFAGRSLLVSARRGCRRQIEADAAGSKHVPILLSRLFSQTGVVCRHHRRRAVGVHVHVADTAFVAAASRSPAVGGRTLDAYFVNADNHNTPLQPFLGPYHCQSPRNARQMSSWADIIPSVPEFAQHWTVWGGSGILLKTIHHNGAVPYWACMAITNIIVRSSLTPLVIQSAHISSRFAKVAPEVQFLITIFQKDIKGLRDRNESPVTQFLVMKATWQTLSALYKVHKIHPFAIFKAPLMQLPVFWYFSIDLRKIINGADPGLAQSLTEGGLLWVTDLTEPDPWYGLPILGGLLLYANVEVALGKKILSGEATSKANVAVTLKDFFQSKFLSSLFLNRKEKQVWSSNFCFTSSCCVLFSSSYVCRPRRIHALLYGSPARWSANLFGNELCFYHVSVGCSSER